MRNSMIFLIVSMIFVMLLIGCAGEDKPPAIEPPTVSAIAYQTSILIHWDDSPQADKDDFRGYLLYIADLNIDTLSETALDTYKIWVDPMPDKSYSMRDYKGEPLDMTAIYWFGVRAVRRPKDTDMLSPLAIYDASPVKYNDYKIYNFASDSICAFIFKDQTGIYSTDTHSEPDIYLDGSGSELVLKSPHLAGIAWTNQTKFKELPEIELDSIITVTDELWADTSIVAFRKTIAIKTGDNHYAIINIVDSRQSAEEKYVKFKYKYQTKPFYPKF